MRVSRLRAASIFGLAALAALVVGGTGYAATPAKSNANTNKVTNATNTLKISPVRTELTAKQGESAKVTVFVTNMSKAPIVLKAIENDFVAGDESGTPSLILSDTSYAPTHSLKRFMQPIPNVTVEAGATKEVNVTINVNKNAQAGGFYGALRFVPADSGPNSSVSLSGSVSSLILLTVPGDLVENLTMTNFDIQQKGTVGTNFRTPDSLELALRFQNTGNVHSAPFGQVNVKKGNKVIYKTDFNNTDPKSNVLPDSARKWTVPLQKMGKFGKYTVVGTFTYGKSNKTIEAEKTIWIVPTMYIIGGIAGILILLLIIILIIALIKAKRGGGSRRSSRRYY